jgi:hypothetical protein
MRWRSWYEVWIALILLIAFSFDGCAGRSVQLKESRQFTGSICGWSVRKLPYDPPAVVVNRMQRTSGTVLMPLMEPARWHDRFPKKKSV